MRPFLRGVEAVVHAGGQAQGDVSAALERRGTLRLAEEFLNAVGKTLGLEHGAGLHHCRGRPRWRRRDW